MNSHALRAEAGRYTFLRDELLRRFPSLAEDDQALADSLEGISDLDEAIAAVARSVDDDEILLSGIEARRSELDARYLRIETRVVSKKGAIFEAMCQAGKPKVELPFATISLRNNPVSVVVTDETAIPPKYMTTPEPPAPKPDKRAILAALKEGAAVMGCELSNPSQSIQWRKK